MKKIYQILTTILFFLMGCSTDIDTLQLIGDKLYEIDSKTPFSGSVVGTFKKDGFKGQGYVKDGEKDGLWTEWYDNGKKRSEGTWKDGKQDGLWTEWWDNGKKESEGTWKDGRYDGLWTGWWKNGQKESVGNWKNGKADGLWNLWYENGQIMLEFEYKNGKPNDSFLFKRWNEDGTEKTEPFKWE